MQEDTADTASLVSVVIPAFNAALWIEATLQSVTSQTHRNLQIVVVDDGSSDETVALAERDAAADDRIQVLSRANGGVAAARNEGLRVARGELVAWLDADDLWHPTKIEKQLSVFRSSPQTSFVYTGYRTIDADGRVKANHRTLADVSGWTLPRQVATNFFSNVSSVVARTDLVRAVGGFDQTLRSQGFEGAEDFLMQMRLSSFGPVGCVREALVGYRQHDRNMSSDPLISAASNAAAIEIIAREVPTLSSWVIRMGQARVIGYSFHLWRQRRYRASLSLMLSQITARPIYATLTLALIIRHMFRRSAIDPALGKPFATSDPATVPWVGHMVLSKYHARRLRRREHRSGFKSEGLHKG